MTRLWGEHLPMGSNNYITELDARITNTSVLLKVPACFKFDYFHPLLCKGWGLFPAYSFKSHSHSLGSKFHHWTIWLGCSHRPSEMGSRVYGSMTNWTKRRQFLNAEVASTDLIDSSWVPPKRLSPPSPIENCKEGNASAYGFIHSEIPQQLYKTIFLTHNNNYPLFTKASANKHQPVLHNSKLTAACVRL